MFSRIHHARFGRHNFERDFSRKFLAYESSRATQRFETLDRVPVEEVLCRPLWPVLKGCPRCWLSTRRLQKTGDASPPVLFPDNEKQVVINEKRKRQGQNSILL
ncbi:hypothetical protein AFLA_003870 [Aspergillus flavus NRRL3357]|nr:hypothetical protein AFLA_003870 [Aspergillus flavus NRRL3357]